MPTDGLPVTGHNELDVPEQKALKVPFPSIVYGDWGAPEDKRCFEITVEANTTIVAEPSHSEWRSHRFGDVALSCR